MSSVNLLTPLKRLAKWLISPLRRGQVKRQSGDLLAVSKSRWVKAKPHILLTWGREVSGEPFIQKVASFGVFDAAKTILEIGPGYGRLLKACLKVNVPFNNYVGVDISAENVEYLTNQFGAANIRFQQGDIEHVVLDVGCDIVISSLTLKHLFPTFEKGLTNVANYVKSGGMLCFDLIEGEMADFESDGVTYVRWYTKEEVQEILSKAGLEHLAYDYVDHCPDKRRLLVVARKPIVAQA